MNRQSVFFTISISFIISILLVLISFVILMMGNHQRFKHSLVKKYEPIVRMFSHRHFGHIGSDLNEYLNSLNYELIDKPNLIEKIIKNPKKKVLIRGKKRFRFNIISIEKKRFIYIKRHGKIFLIKDKNENLENQSKYIILIFMLILVALILSFGLTIKKLMPLKLLKNEVSSLGDEKFDFSFDVSKKDEVSLLAQEFQKSANKLKNIKEARNVFIRNIMHELKTPITKGRFLMQLPRNEQNDTKLGEIFIRLELLINEFASIEELISLKKNIPKKYYFLDDIIDNAKDMLMIEDKKVICKYQNKKLKINFKLFSIAIKNLIDNGVKYSQDKKVTIKNAHEDIIFENKGEALEHELKKYYEPFFTNKHDKNSFGLGIYIIHHTLKANGYGLEYEYKNGINIFRCKKIS